MTRLTALILMLHLFCIFIVGLSASKEASSEGTVRRLCLGPIAGVVDSLPSLLSAPSGPVRGGPLILGLFLEQYENNYSPDRYGNHRFADCAIVFLRVRVRIPHSSPLLLEVQKELTPPSRPPNGVAEFCLSDKAVHIVDTPCCQWTPRFSCITQKWQEVASQWRCPCGFDAYDPQIVIWFQICDCTGRHYTTSRFCGLQVHAETRVGDGRKA
jgi:hypothetical protein